jgi:hypothetical protein
VRIDHGTVRPVSPAPRQPLAVPLLSAGHFMIFRHKSRNIPASFQNKRELHASRAITDRT